MSGREDNNSSKVPSMIEELVLDEISDLEELEPDDMNKSIGGAGATNKLVSQGQALDQKGLYALSHGHALAAQTDFAGALQDFQAAGDTSQANRAAEMGTAALDIRGAESGVGSHLDDGVGLADAAADLVAAGHKGLAAGYAEEARTDLHDTADNTGNGAYARGEAYKYLAEADSALGETQAATRDTELAQGYKAIAAASADGTHLASAATEYDIAGKAFEQAGATTQMVDSFHNAAADWNSAAHVQHNSQTQASDALNAAKDYGRFSDAGDQLDEAKMYALAGADLHDKAYSEEAGTILQQLAGQDMTADNYQGAESLYKRAFGAFEAASDHQNAEYAQEMNEGLADALGAAQHNASGQLIIAGQLFSAATKEFREAGDQIDAQNNFAAAKADFEAALTDVGPNWERVSHIYNDLSTLESNFGHENKAQTDENDSLGYKYAEQAGQAVTASEAAEAFQKAADHFALAGNTQQADNNYLAAAQHWEQAAQTSTGSQQTDAYNSAATSFLAGGHPKQAAENFLKAAEGFSSIYDYSGAATAYADAGNAMNTAKEYGAQTAAAFESAAAAYSQLGPQYDSEAKLAYENAAANYDIAASSGDASQNPEGYGNPTVWQQSANEWQEAAEAWTSAGRTTQANVAYHNAGLDFAYSAVANAYQSITQNTFMSTATADAMVTALNNAVEMFTLAGNPNEAEHAQTCVSLANVLLNNINDQSGDPFNDAQQELANKYFQSSTPGTPPTLPSSIVNNYPDQQ